MPCQFQHVHQLLFLDNKRSLQQANLKNILDGYLIHLFKLVFAAGNIGYLSELIGGNGVQFRRTPADYDYSWHTAPRRQFIVNLDAAVEIEVSSGERRVIAKGEVFFVEDTTGKLIVL